MIVDIGGSRVARSGATRFREEQRRDAVVGAWLWRWPPFLRFTAALMYAGVELQPETAIANFHCLRRGTSGQNLAD